MLNKVIIQKNKILTIILIIITTLFVIFITSIMIICYQFYPQEDPNENESIWLFFRLSLPSVNQWHILVTNKILFYLLYLFVYLFIFSHFSKYCKFSYFHFLMTFSIFNNHFRTYKYIHEWMNYKMLSYHCITYPGQKLRSHD